MSQLLKTLMQQLPYQQWQAQAAGTDDDETIGTGNDARIAALNRIGLGLDRSRADEFADVNDDETTSQFVVDELSDEEQGRREAALQAGDDDTVKKELERAEREANQTGEDDDEPKPVKTGDEVQPVKHKLKVNGKDLELTTEELIARAQKVESADQYLVDAAKSRKEAEDLLTQHQTERTNSGPTAEETATAEAAELEERRALARAIQMGNEDEAVAAIEQLQRKAAQPTVDAASIARSVDERMSFNKAVEQFRSEYADIVDDPTLLNLALQRDLEMVNKGDKRPYYDRFKEVGDGLRSWLGGMKGKTATGEVTKETTDATEKTGKDKVDTSQQRTQRKQEVAARSSTASATGVRARATTTAEEDNRPENPQEVIAAMARQRGGPQWMRGMTKTE